MTAVPDGMAQLNILISVDVMMSLDEVAATYGMAKAFVGQALLAHALCDDQIEIAIQKSKDASDQRLRATRQKRRGSASSEETGVFPIAERRIQKS